MTDTQESEAVAKVLDILHGELSAGVAEIEGEHNAALLIVALFADERATLTRQLAEAREALKTLARVIKEGALVPLPGYSDELAALHLIERTLKNVGEANEPR